MLNSTKRKQALSGWLQKNDSSSYSSPLRLQKFLFLYEAFSKLEGADAEFSGLKGYVNGPVFSAVYGDYGKEKEAFNLASAAAYEVHGGFINEGRISRSDFIIKSMSEKELSDLTHKFHIWNVKCDRIMSGEKEVKLDEPDFNEDDVRLTEEIKSIYPDEMIQNSQVVPVAETYFVFSRSDAARLTEQHMDALKKISRCQDLHNPVFAELDSEGALCID